MDANGTKTRKESVGAEIRGTDGWPANNGLSQKGAELLSTIQVGMLAFVQLAQGVPPVVLLGVETLGPPFATLLERKPDGVSTYGGHQHPLIHAATPLKLAKITTQ
ncbi:uncharacterized protein Triagg1_8004 [Trichoderma aggressivum f. europaeum]|uniref:Uncharacterized protein n=1 Tax=Trichoderma aggressivum f. europaeum TaxID=173218 RepID=A0AAE1ICU4_9HYPO|nr:hypothetical protein Triagg1_8004 [Trichoderma aggressivum f. europaeum]